jgi:dextranase
MTELLPARAVFLPGEAPAVEIRGFTGVGTIRVRHWGHVVAEQPWTGDGFATLDALPPGGYAVELLDGGEPLARTAIEVVADPRASMRYGFVVDYRPGRELSAVADNLRRLHLTAVQFYDWAYRHADLLGGGEQYDDALGQPVSLDTVRELVSTCHSIGADALGYAAVYAAGPKEWTDWEHAALLTPTGAPYSLGDFLFIVDPAHPDWCRHFRGDLADACAQIGFDGFHLDQYGYPKRAVRPDGVIVDVAHSFGTMLDEVRAELPDARLVFNNVNDFPTWSSAAAPQDAVYIEVWPPHVELDDLARVVNRARAAGAGKPVVIAAYQHVYDSAPAEPSDRATALTMATLFSHGATHLLCGEADRILVDPYYVRNHAVEHSTSQLLIRWYDFLVEHAELLLPPDIADVTGSYVGDYNDDLDVGYADTPVTGHAVAGAVWRRITQVGDRLVVHLINLAGQADTLWDASRAEAADTGVGTLRLRRVGTGIPRVRVADPDRGGSLVEVAVRVDGDHAVAELPAPHLWQLVLIDPVA